MSARGFDNAELRATLLRGLDRKDLPVKVFRIAGYEHEGYAQIPETPAKLAALGRDPGLLNYVVMVRRPGARIFACHLEHTYYDPCDKAVNDKLQARIVEWDGMLWEVVSVPASDRQNVVNSAVKAGLRIVDGMPTMLFGTNYSEFPLQGRNSFTLENLPNAPFYRGAASEELALAMESEDCDELMRNTRARYEAMHKK